MSHTPCSELENWCQISCLSYCSIPSRIESSAINSSPVTAENDDGCGCLLAVDVAGAPVQREGQGACGSITGSQNEEGVPARALIQTERCVAVVPLKGHRLHLKNNLATKNYTPEAGSAKADISIALLSCLLCVQVAGHLWSNKIRS